MPDFPLDATFADALTLAAAWHTGQYRKVPPGQTPSLPYVSHLLGVASIALEYGADQTEAIAALLHDALEDGPAHTGRTPEDLRAEMSRRFGEPVAALVDGATDDTPPPGQPKRPWADRKTGYLRHLPTQPAPALLVSASDKLHNARTILADISALPAGERDGYFGRFREGRDGTLQYYRLLSDQYLAAPATHTRPRLHDLARELDRTVTALEQATGLTSDQARQLPLLRPAPASQ